MCGNESALSAPIEILSKPATQGGLSVSANTDTGDVSVSWEQAKPNADYYNVKEVTSGALQKINEPVRKAIFSNRNNGNYSYIYSACNKYDSCSDWSDSQSIDLLRKPNSVNSLAVTGDLENGEYTITWNSPTGPVDYYEYREKLNGVWLDYQNIDLTQQLGPILKPDGTYEYAIRACNTQGCGPEASTGSLRIVHPQPQSPTELKVEHLSGALYLSWIRSADGNDDAYEFRLNGEGWQATDTLTGTTQRIGGYGLYQFDVRACNLIPEGRKCSDPVAVSYDYVDPDPSSPGWAKRASPELYIPGSATIQPSLATHHNVQVLAGEGSVSGGAASYQVPLTLPLGRNNVMPSVSFAYSSRSGSSTMGMGWSLAAGSAISRCPQTLIHDGRKIGVQYNATNDRLCIDGQRLLLVAGTYGQSGAEYRTELDTFARITQSGAINSSGTSFKVEMKDGRVRHYGVNTNSRHIASGRSQVLTWALSREDGLANGNNSIHYEYQSFGSGEYELADIYYTGNSSTVGNRHIEFIYSGRPDRSSQYLAGGLTRQTQRLDSVQISLEGLPVREYQLGYGTSAASSRSLLNSITECGYDALGLSQCGEPTTFTWQDSSNAYLLEKFGYRTGAGNWQENGAEPTGILQDVRRIDQALPRGDFNGDGVRDWSGYHISAEGELTGTFIAGEENCFRNSYAGRYECAEIDIDQDGKTDGWRRQSDQLQIATKRDSAGNFIWNSTSIALTNYDRILNSDDYNGDGWPDLFILRDVGPAAPTNKLLYLYLHTGNPDNAFINNGREIVDYEYHIVQRLAKYDVQFMGDVDGNGLPDLLVSEVRINITGADVVSAPQPRPSYFLYAESDGTSVNFVPVDATAELPALTVDDLIINHYTFIDMNADGLTDWLKWSGAGENLQYRLNKGNRQMTGWVDLGLPDAIPSRSYRHNVSIGDPAIAHVRAPKYLSAFKQMDTDNDGRAELLFPGQRLVTSCQTRFDYQDFKEFCGDDLYGWRRPYDREPPIYSNIPASNFDRGIYQFDGIRFVEQSNGSITAEYFTSDIVGSAYQSAVVDATGNGLMDLVFAYGCDIGDNDCRIETASGVMAGKAQGVYILRNRGSVSDESRYEPTDMLIAVENGFGTRDEWHYRPLSSRDDRYHSSAKPFYERGGYLDSLSSSVQEDHFEFTSSMYVVAEHRQSNGVGGLNKKQYRYKGAVFNNKGRGFQGFHSIIEEDLAADIETQSDFHQIFPLAGKLHKQRQWELADRTADTSGVNAFKESTFEWQFWPKGGHSSPTVVDALTDSWNVSANDPYFVGPKEQSSIYRTLKRSGNSRTHLYTQSQTTSFDAWGNVLLAENRYEEANSSHIVVSTTDTQYAAADQTNWWINKPSKQTVTKKSIQSRKGVAIAANTDTQQSVVVDFLQWDSNARKPKQVKTTPSNGKWTQVDTVYNNYGLPTKVTTSAEGEAQTRVAETTAFSTDGYFPKTVKNALGHTATTETNAKFGKPDSVTDANGLTTRYSYDAFGRAIKVTAPSALGLKAAPDIYTALQWCNSGCSRAPAAVFKTIQQQAGTPEQITYHDQLGRVIRTEVQAFDGSDWIARTVTYNTLGQTTFESVPHYASSGTSYGTRYLDYDTFGRALRKTVNQTNGQQLDVTYTHEQASGFTTDILVNGRLMSRTYNGLQQLTETVDALSGTTRYAYDGAGNPIVLQDANSNRITANYNALGQKEWVDDPNMGAKSFTYTGFGEVETEIDGNLDITSFTYDRLGRMESRSVNGTEEASWKFDSAANGKGLLARESRSDASYARSYSYDALSRPYKVTTAIDGEDFVTQSHFDSNYGRLKGLSYPSGLTLQYGYNSTGYQFRTSNAASGYTYREITQMDAWGEWEFASIAAGNYTIGRSFHGETGQMAGTTFDSLVQNHQGIAYSYDSFGNLFEQVVQLPSESPALNVENHYYDVLNRLDYSTRTDGPGIDYDYDAIGNLLKKDDFASSYSYTGGSNGGPSAVKSVSLINGGTKTYGYDQNGNRTHENGAQQIWYNAFNKPTRINRNGANLYFYYGADQMRYKQVNQTSGKTTLYIDKLFEKITGGGETQYRHFIGDIAVLTTTEKGSDVTHQIGFSHRDRLGSTAAVGDEAGNLRESHSFDPFGKPRQGNILDKDTAILESTYSTRGFTDHEHLDDVALIHMNGRAYDYNLGRFLSVDPVIQSPGNSQSLNPYSYIMNNPLAGTDPSGYTPDCIQSDDGTTTCTGTVKVNQTGSRIVQRVTATTTTSGATTSVHLSGGNGGAQQTVAGIITATLKSTGFRAVDIGSQASRGNLQGDQGAADSGQSGGVGNSGLNENGVHHQQVCHMGCHGIEYSEHRQATDEELVPLHITAAVIDLATPLPPIVTAFRTPKAADAINTLRAASATKGASKALRPVGSILESVNDVLANPKLLAGKTPAQVHAIIGKTPGWKVETLRKGSRKGEGWVFREYKNNGKLTGQVIRWHPGSARKGGDAYWRVTDLINGKSDPIF
ncbi:hypothetical protein GL2_36550 [Microbulbifer sp. GL-2]|nr:hypothetical protein GL2_36550 [Microbulbifer sp. GL-2]